VVLVFRTVILECLFKSQISICVDNDINIPYCAKIWCPFYFSPRFCSQKLILAPLKFGVAYIWCVQILANFSKSPKLVHTKYKHIIFQNHRSASNDVYTIAAKYMQSLGQNAGVRFLASKLKSLKQSWLYHVTTVCISLIETVINLAAINIVR